MGTRSLNARKMGILLVLLGAERHSDSYSLTLFCWEAVLGRGTVIICSFGVVRGIIAYILFWVI